MILKYNLSHNVGKNLFFFWLAPCFTWLVNKFVKFTFPTTCMIADINPPKIINKMLNNSRNKIFIIILSYDYIINYSLIRLELSFLL
ncbi:MAG: hypothetical protein CI953_1581 [Methanohalophilus sp.]|nr:MAG: hypothetical protein CI953_1581 [Methanohalophilus sp.]